MYLLYLLPLNQARPRPRLRFPRYTLGYTPRSPCTLCTFFRKRSALPPFGRSDAPCPSSLYSYPARQASGQARAGRSPAYEKAPPADGGQNRPPKRPLGGPLSGPIRGLNIYKPRIIPVAFLYIFASKTIPPNVASQRAQNGPLSGPIRDLIIMKSRTLRPWSSGFLSLLSINPDGYVL